jgi:cytochrome P450
MKIYTFLCRFVTKFVIFFELLQTPECSFISYFPTFIGTFYHIQDPVAIKALFKEFRGSSESNGLFTPTRSIKTLLNILKEAFPENDITEEDVIFTCSHASSKYYRAWLHHLLDGKHIANYRPIIREEADKTLKNWALRCEQGQPIRLSEAALFASQIITRLMFGHKVGGEALAKAVNIINWYTLYKQIGKVSQQDEEKYKQALTTFKETVEEVIDDVQAPLFAPKNQNTLTLEQKKAMAFIIFFAGQETTGFLLGNILRHLAQNNHLQSALRAKIQKKDLLKEKDIEIQAEIENLITQSLADYPPSYAISRRIMAEKDICLEYVLEGEEKPRKLIMNRGDLVSARMIDAAKRINASSPQKITQERSYDLWSAFGGGAHSCPGKNLALTEVFEFILLAIQGYNLTTNQSQEPHVVGQITLQFIENITIKLSPLTQ